MARKNSVQSEDVDVLDMPSNTRVYVWASKLSPRGMIYDEKGRQRPEQEYARRKNIPPNSFINWPGGTDPFSGKERAKGRYPIRYYAGCETLFKDGQPKDAEIINQAIAGTKDILFVDGYLEIPEYDTMFVKYVDWCSYNTDSPYGSPTSAKLFSPLDAEKIAKDEIDLIGLAEQALELASKASVKHMRIHARFLEIPEMDHKSGMKYSTEAIRAKYKKAAFEKPRTFIATYSDKTIQVSEWIKDALNTGKIDTEMFPNQAVWKEAGIVICGLSGIKTREGIMNKLIEFSQVDDGAEFLEQLKAIYS